jgi:hypothetical protein
MFHFSKPITTLFLKWGLFYCAKLRPDHLFFQRFAAEIGWWQFYTTTGGFSGITWRSNRGTPFLTWRSWMQICPMGSFW